MNYENLDPNNPIKEYTGVWIPKEVMESEDLNATEKLAYGEIACFDICYASNAWLAKRIGKSEVVASRAVKKLIDLGFVESCGFNGRFRQVRVVKNDKPSQKRQGRVVKNDKSALSKMTNIDKSKEQSIDNYNNVRNKASDVCVVQNECIECTELAKRLHELILINKPDRKIDKNWLKNWSYAIDKMHRIDGRKFEDIRKAIEWSQRNSFWKRNILSGEKLREKYDRLDDQARFDREANQSQQIATTLNNMTNEQLLNTWKELNNE